MDWAPEITSLPQGAKGRESLRNYIEGSGGPPRILSPLPPYDPERRPEELPLLVFLPGIDGTGYTPASQFPQLAERFDLRTFLIPVHDRTPLEGLVQIVKQYVEYEIETAPRRRPIYLCGESFGGILALLAGEACGAAVNRLILVNPATSFQDSIWSTVGGVIPALPPQAYDLLPFAISPLLGNPLNLASKAVDSRDPLPNQAVQAVGGLFRLLPVLDNLKEILPQDTLAWKLRLLDEGSTRVTAALPRIRQRTLVIAGEVDLLVPSLQESDRLKRALPFCSVKVVEGAGHALLQENVSLCEVLDETGFYVSELKFSAGSPNRASKKPKVQPVDGKDKTTPIELPTTQEVREACRALGLERAKVSPSLPFPSLRARIPLPHPPSLPPSLPPPHIIISQAVRSA